MLTPPNRNRIFGFGLADVPLGGSTRDFFVRPQVAPSLAEHNISPNSTVAETSGDWRSFWDWWGSWRKDKSEEEPVDKKEEAQKRAPEEIDQGIFKNATGLVVAGLMAVLVVKILDRG